MIKIDNKISIQLIEQAYNELFAQGSIDILISKGKSSADFGLVPAIIQFFATWYNISKDGKIIFDIKTEEEISELYNYDYLFPSIVYCWNRAIIDINGKDLKPVLKTYNQEKHEKMKKQTEGGGNRVLLSCFDHLPIKQGLLTAFYDDGLFITNELQFDYAIEKSIRLVTALNKNLRIANLAHSYSDLISIIYELFKNTDDWGKTDEFNKPLNPNSRGLFLKLHRRTRDSFILAFNDNDGVKNYFSEKNFESNAQGELYFLEISVYDTGIGFVRRNLKQEKREHNTKEQVEIIRKCLLKNITTATGIDKGIKGQGLDRIMRILDNKGLFWIRTQNVSVFRNLRENRYKENIQSSDIQLFDWFKYSDSEYSALQPVQGSIITLVYPISNISYA